MYKAIAANKRNTILIMTVFVALIGAIGWVVGAYYGDLSITYIIFGVALVYALIQYFASSSIAIGVSGATQIELKDDPRFYRTVENLAITLGMDTPKIYIINDPAPNAFATGRDPKHAVVAATSGLLSIMNDRELGAVMAHEMGHVKNYDIRVSMIVFGLVSAIGLLSDVIMRMFFFGGNRRSNNSEISPVMIVVGIVVIVLAPIVALGIQMAISRQREYLADASSALTTRDPEGLVSALQKLEQYGRPMAKQNSSMAHLYISDPLKPGFFSKLFSTHPPLADRISRLQANDGKF